MLNEPEENWSPENFLHYIEVDRYRGGVCTGEYLLAPALSGRLALRQ